MALAAVSTVWTAVIAGVASVLAASGTLAAARHTANSKLRELELTYEQKLHGDYLATARQHTKTTYEPLARELGRLSTAFQTFRDGLQAKTRQTTSEEEEAFRAACHSFLAAINKMISGASSAYLTTELEDFLRSFATFLGKSLASTEPAVGLVWMGRSVMAGPGLARLARIGEVVSGVGSVAFAPLSLIGPRVQKLIEAPITSSEFEARMVYDLRLLNQLVKEVTLGPRAGP